MLTQSFYSSTILLAKGLSQYSVNVGSIRDDYALASDHYGGLLSEFSYRRGITDRVTLELNDGRRLDSGDIRFPRGNAQLPLEDAELKAKFLDCTAGAKDVNAEMLYERLRALDELGSVGELIRA